LAYGGGNGAASLGVPEPASLMLILLGSTFFAMLRRRSVRILQRPS
jgi:hypothetical protein